MSLAIIAVTAAILHMYGRSLICPCGFVKLFWWGPRGDLQESQHLLDIYSATHMLHGILLYFLIWLIGRGRVPPAAGLIIAVLLESGWELWENSNYLIDRYNKAGVVYAGDSIINSVGDLLVMMLGFLIAATAPIWVSVLILVGTEVGLALLIRDNLLLNIINLIHPIDWISKWQELR
jgi:hypothetical protein